MKRCGNKHIKSLHPSHAATKMENGTQQPFG